MVTQKDKKENQKVSLGNIVGGKLEFRDIDEILNRKVSKYGNSCHVPVPSKHEGKEAQVIIWKQEKKEEEKSEKL